DDVVVGCAYPEGEQGYNVARMAALGAGLKTPGVTVNRLCGSSLEAASIAAARVAAGFGQMYLIGGVESMSRVSRRGAGFSESDLIRQVSPEAYINMGETAEKVSVQFNIGRREQEEFAAHSHELAHEAQTSGRLNPNIY